MYEKIKHENKFVYYDNDYPVDAFKNFYNSFKFSNSILRSCKQFDINVDQEETRRKN